MDIRKEITYGFLAGKRVSLPWYRAGGIPLANVVGAYQAKGAASYAASKVNLAVPSTHDLADGAAYPAFDTADGWTFTAVANKGLISDIVPASGYSALVRFSDKTTTPDQFLFGAYNTVNARFDIGPTQGASGVAYSYGTQKAYAPILQSGVLALTPSGGFRNGVSDGVVSAWGNVTRAIYIGEINLNGTPFGSMAGKIQAISFYNIDIAPYMAALVAAINGL